MKKTIFIIPCLLGVCLISPVFAAKNSEVGAQNANSGQGTQQTQLSPSPTGNQVQNKNKIKTQNQGEEDQLEVSNQEQEASQSNKPNDRSETARERMSLVAQKVEELLTSPDRQGGIGQQVREIAQSQNEIQKQIKTELEKVETKNNLMKRLFGPDYKALKNLNKQLEQNQLRIEQLEQLQTQLTNQGDITMVQETIQALVQQNTSLQDIITNEEQIKSLFGWLSRFFTK